MHHDDVGALAGGGELGALIRNYRWADTPLGPISSWPQSLLSVVGMLLPSKAQIILFWGSDFTVLYNDAYRPVFGAKHPVALGLPGREAWSEIWNGMLHDLLDGVVRTGEAFWAKDLLFVIERNGFVEETYFDVSYDPVRIESGDVGGVYCIVTETTERVVSTRRLSLLNDLGSRLAGVLTTRDACTLAIETLGHYPEMVPFAMVHLDGDVAAATPDAAARIAQVDPSLVLELPITAPAAGRSGTLVVGRNPRRPADAAYRTFLDLIASQLGTALTSVQAYEEEKRRAEALAAIDRAKTIFFSNVSHEFRTPLTLILGPVRDLLGDPSLSAVQREQLDLVHRNSLRLLKLVNTVLDFSRIESGRIDASFEPTDLSALTADLASTFRSAVEREGLHLAVECAPLGTLVDVDRDMWEKIVLNLLSNVFKYTVAGSITVSLSPIGHAAVLTVTDTGAGIPEKELGRIFDRFHRVEGVHGRTDEGTGIGLALVKELVRMHEGSITVESTVGAGSSFHVTIPFTARATSDPARRPAPIIRHAAEYDERAFVAGAPLAGAPAGPPPRGDGRRPRVLIADDNADMRAYLVRILGAHHDVEAVADGAAALAAAKAQRPDLILADVMMPHVDGFALLRDARADPALRTVPFVLLSARAGEEASVDGLEAGADDYLVKPFTVRELLARVTTHLELARVRREAERQLRDADRRKDEFLATLAHELRNPLAPIRTGLEVLRLGAANAVDAERVRATMERQVGHMVRLIDDLLDVSRITSGKVVLEPRPTPLAMLVDGAVEATQGFLAERGLRFTVVLPEADCTLDADRTRFVQILSNLLHNAAKFTPEGGTVELRAELVTRDSGEAGVVITVADNGIGVPADVLPHVFELFVQAEGGDAPARGGLGIGLTLVRRLVEMHGGTVEAASAGRGKGTQLTISMPVSATSARAESTPIAQHEFHETARRVLIIDDNQDAASVLAILINSLGGRSRVAHDGAAGLAIAREFAPDVVLLDIGMPGLDGYETCRALREIPGGRHMVIAALTGWGQEGDRQRAVEAGFDTHLTKPADPDAIKQVLERAGARKRSTARV